MSQEDKYLKKNEFVYVLNSELSSNANFDENESEQSQISADSDNSCRKIKHSKSRSTPIYPDESEQRKKISAHYRRFSSLTASAKSRTDKFVRNAQVVAKKIAEYGYELISHWELPEWLKDNIYLHHFHRPPLKQFNLCFRSIFSIHTETGNIWTHLLGLIILFIAMIIIFLRPYFSAHGYPYPKGIVEYMCFGAFFIGGCSCLTFSWLYHTLFCHSQAINKLFAKLDYCGISFLICGSMIPVFYFSFYCNTKLMALYMFIATLMAGACILASLTDCMSTPTFRPIRGCIFLTFGLSSIFPIIHHFIIYPAKYSLEVTQLYLLVTMGALYVSGCLIYMLLIPERFFPGRLNVYFQSHQIFHICVVVACLVHLRAICNMSKFRALKGRMCLPNEYFI